MIGAGFSKCASKSRPGASDPPLWRDLEGEFKKSLYPQHNASDFHARTSPAGDFLKLAQEFEAAFGRVEMNRLLQDLIRDVDLNPGDMHQRLLRLPWRDVFTTNWDTLLERSSVLVAERKYGVVRNKDEIPLADGPRIVKLHGSFPAHFPLICTQEDYRTYPKLFAPFVNTVQQSMMETIFCLIGFSGDDPNFLHWTGWVRDNLGKSAPKIYLAGWLELEPHQRRMLEDHNVVPIDLARHPKAEIWPEHRRHDYSTNWILHTLERGRPYDVTDWPAKRTWSFNAIPKDLLPVETLEIEDPQNEWQIEYTHDSDITTVQVQQMLDAWTRNRQLYPGWLAVPFKERSNISGITRDWEPRVLQALPDFTPVRRLVAIRELVWRREILLDPISFELESAAESVLHQIDCQNRTIDGVADTQIAWGEIREAWIAVVLALITVARHHFDHAVFLSRIESLSTFLNDDPEITQRLHHERCLWAIYSMDFPKLQAFVKDWSTESCDPMWLVRKAAILHGLNRTDDAGELFDRALLAIRQIPDDDSSVAGPSREGWALWLAWSLKWSQWPASEGEEIPNAGQFHQRWRELATVNCDALSERDGYLYPLQERGRREDAPAFDLGMQTLPGVVFPHGIDPQWVAAHRVVRLTEVAGLPAELGILKPAIGVLSATEPELAVRIILHTSTYDGDPEIKRALSRTRVANMPLELVVKPDAACNSIIKHASRVGMSEAGGREPFWLARLQVAIEVQSRLVIRLDPDKVETAFNKAIRYYENNGDIGARRLADPVRNMLNRTWEALPEQSRARRVFDILGLPIVGMGKFAEDAHRYPEPGDLLIGFPPKLIRENGDVSQWRGIVGLLVQGLEAGGEARKRAAIRVASEPIRNNLSKDEAGVVAKALWKEPFVHLPAIESLLYDWVFQILPEPEMGIAEQGFRCKWLVAEENSSGSYQSPEEVLWQVGQALISLEYHGHSLQLSEDECAYLTEIVGKWLTTPIPTLDPFSSFDEQVRATRRAIPCLSFFVPKVEFPKVIGERLFEKLRNLNEGGIPAYEPVLVLAMVLPDRLEDITSWLRVGLASDDSKVATSAMWGLERWLRESRTSSTTLQVPPEDLVREIGIMIATRRKASLRDALKVAKWVFEEGSPRQQDAVRDMVLHGLEYLCDELSYDSESDDDLPMLRWRSAQLALAMAACGFENNSTITRWLTIVENDPLPEVRYAKGPPYISAPNGRKE